MVVTEGEIRIVVLHFNLVGEFLKQPKGARALSIKKAPFLPFF